MAPQSKKKSTQRGAAYAQGGSTRMFGRGDRTTTAATEAANTQKPGAVGHKTGAGPRFAAGSESPRSGGVSKPASPSRTGPSGEPASASTRDYPGNAKTERGVGGISRPARP